MADGTRKLSEMLEEVSEATDKIGDLLEESIGLLVRSKALIGDVMESTGGALIVQNEPGRGTRRHVYRQPTGVGGYLILRCDAVALGLVADAD